METALILLGVWLVPVAITSAINYLYAPAVRMQRAGTKKMIQRCVLIFYRYHYQVRSVREAEVCPLCKRKNMRCRVTINPLSGMRVHTSLNRRRRPPMQFERVAR